MRQVIFFACRQWKEEIEKIDFWVVVICETVFFSLFFWRYGKYTGKCRGEGGNLLCAAGFPAKHGLCTDNIWRIYHGCF